MPRRTQIAALCTKARWLLLVYCLNAFSGVRANTPDDLQLTSAESQRSEALSHFAWGFFLQLEGREEPDAFLSRYAQALALSPDSQTILGYLATPMLIGSDFEKLVEYIRPIAEANPDRIKYYLVLCEALMAQNKVGEAISVLERGIEQASGDVGPLLRELFVCYWKETRHEDIERVLRRSAGRRSLRGSFALEHAAAIFYSSRAELPEIKDDDKARARFQATALRRGRRALRRVDQATREADIASLAGMFMNLGAWADAVRLLEAARSRDTFSGIELDLLLADAYVQLGSNDRALAVLDAVSQDAAYSPYIDQELARLYQAAGELENAVLFYERALAVHPEAVGLRFRLAYLCLRLDRPEKTLTFLRPFAKLPAEAYLVQSYAHRRLKQNQEAAKSLAMAEQKARADGNEDFFTVDFYLFFATLCMDLGYTERALEMVRNALEKQPDDPVCANFLGYVLADNNQELGEAEAWIRKALDAEPDNYAYIDSLAWVLYRKERYAEALVEINRALRLSGPNPDPVILDHAGDIHAANGLFLLARTYWWRAVATGAHEADKIRDKLREVLEEEVPANTIAGGLGGRPMPLK